MKKAITIALILLMICTASITFAQNSTEPIVKADEYVKNKQYNSAFKFLNEIDPENNNSEIVLKKVDILLNYFMISTMHQMFGLKDLKENETIVQLRGKPGVYSYYKFEINTILENLIKKHPANWKLYKSLGEYYYEVYLKYGDNWLKTQNELLELTEKYYLQAEQNNVFDAKSLYAIGYSQLQKNNLEKAIKYFLRSLEIDNNNADTNYNLAYVYLQLGKMDEGLRHAEISLKFYNDKEYKADASRLIAILYRNKNDNVNAIKYYKISEEINPNNYDNLVALLELYIKNKDLKSAATTADGLFSLDLTIHSLGDILGVYNQNGYCDELLEFFKRMEIKYIKNDEVLGNLLFAKAFYYKGIKDWKTAKVFLKEARNRFEKCFKKNHEVFGIIDREIQSIDSEIEFEEAIRKKK